MLGSIADRITHVRKTTLLYQINDQLEFMHALKVSYLRLVTGLNEGLESSLDESRHTTTEHRLLAKQVRLSFLCKRRLKDSGASAADPFRVSQSSLLGVPGYILIHSHESRSPLTLGVNLAHSMPRRFGRYHANIYALRGHNLVVADIEPMREHEGVTLTHGGSDLLLVKTRLNVLRHQHHDDISLSRSLSHWQDTQSRLFCYRP